MKKKILLTSMVTIVLCLCLIAGSTFALFTSESEMNIAVTSGNVKLTASISAVDLYSVRAAVSGDTDTVLDEHGHEYVYEQQQGGTFANGGTADLANGNALTLSKVTPGDKVVLNVASLNSSDVIVKARYTITVEDGEELAKGLIVTIKDANGNVVETLQGLDSFVSSWETLTVGENLANSVIEIELPVSAGNEYQHDNILAANPNYEGVSINILVEAVQGNGVID